MGLGKTAIQRIDSRLVSALAQSSTAAALRDAVDTALIELLTKPHNRPDRARTELTRAVGLLDENPQLDISADAAKAVRSAAEHLSNGAPSDARSALVTACGRLSAPGSRLAARNE